MPPLPLLELDLLLRRAAQAEIMPRFGHLSSGAVRFKTSPLDLVTDADEAAEVLLMAALEAKFPGALVVGEEAVAADPGLLDGLMEADLAFVLDPVDGTANFAAGLPLFGVMMAVLRRGEVVAGLIHDPISGDSAITERGGGAWLVDAQGGKRRLQVAPAAPLSQMTGSLSWRFFPPERRDAIIRVAGQLGGSFDFRCAAHHYRMIAAGHCHCLLFHRLMPWDHAAGWLLHREAGGEGRMLDGSEYRPDVRAGGYLCAPDIDSWQELRRLLTAG